jgi:phospholipase/lecithinase/hemolysin
LAASLPGTTPGSVTLTPSDHLVTGGVASGNNFATGGATILGESGGNNLVTQYGAYMLNTGGLAPVTDSNGDPVLDSNGDPVIAPVPATYDANTLYVIFMGGNDAANAAVAISEASNLTERLTALGEIATIGAEFGTAVGALGTAGATKFLIGTSPDVGATPRFGLENPVGTALSQLTGLLTAGGTRAAAQSLALGGLTIHPAVYDARLAAAALIQDPAYTNTTDFCLEDFATLATVKDDNDVVISTNCPDMLSATTSSNGYFYWDSFHPTSEVHAAIGAELIGVATVLDAL